MGKKKQGSGRAAAPVKIPEHPAIRVEGPSLRKVRNAFEAYGPLLRGVKGVVRVSYGCKQSDGKYGFEQGGRARTVRYAILVYVEKKPAQPMAPTEDGFIPPHICGIPTDIVEAEEEVITPNSGVVSLTQGGPPLTGSYGVVAIDTTSEDDRFFALTNCHVACGPALRPLPGHVVTVTRHGGTALAVGLAGALRGGFFPAGPVNLDCAAVPLADAGAAAAAFRQSEPFGRVRSRVYRDQSQVLMFSRVGNQVLLGAVIDPNAVANLSMGGGVSRTLDGLLKIRSVDDNLSFGVPGDSGSLVIARAGASFIAVGLYIGTAQGEPTVGYAHWLRRLGSDGGPDPNAVLDRLSLDF